MQGYYVGMDGGGTETAVLVSDGTKDLYRMRTGGLNYNSFKKEQITEALYAAAKTLKRQGFAIEDCQAVGIGAAGVSNPDAKRFLEDALMQIGYHCPVRIFGDEEAALSGAFGDEDGMLLISGTGSACLGQTDGGRRRYRSGGFGHLIDDEGSAYAIGRDILSAVVKAEDGRMPATALRAAVFAHLRVNTVPELIAWTYDKTHTKKEIAGLARLLSLPENIKDPAAIQITEHAARGLAEMVEAVYGKMKKYGDESGVPLVLWGSVLRRNEKIAEALERQISERGLLSEIVRPKADAAHGAVRLAIAAAEDADIAP